MNKHTNTQMDRGRNKVRTDVLSVRDGSRRIKERMIHNILYINLYRGKIYQVTHVQVARFHFLPGGADPGASHTWSDGLQTHADDRTLLTRPWQQLLGAIVQQLKQKVPKHSHPSDMQHWNTDSLQDEAFMFFYSRIQPQHAWEKNICGYIYVH